MKHKHWLWVLCCITALDLLAVTIGNRTLELTSKPFLIPTLAIWFYQSTQGNDSKLRKSILWGFAFSTLGDFLLMFVPMYEKVPFFIFGLLAFLIAQLCYSIGFLSKVSLKQGLLIKKPLAILPFLLYYLLLLSFLWGKLPKEMKLPVSVYGAVICFMAISAANWKGNLSLKSNNLVFRGAVLFVLSDTLIAVNKFAIPIVGVHFAIMLTYVLGQYFIAKGTKEVILGE
jgi:uncharacterized membrane protein YhhN